MTADTYIIAGFARKVVMVYETLKKEPCVSEDCIKMVVTLYS